MKRAFPWPHFLIAALFLFCSSRVAIAAATDTAAIWQLAETNPGEVMRQAVQHEMDNSYGRREPARYVLRKVTTTADTTRLIVETQDGDVSRWIGSGGKPLSAEDEKNEIQRLHDLDQNPSLQARHHRNEVRDIERMQKFMHLLPNAFLYTYSGSVEQNGNKWIRIRFAPNPKFSPPDFESRMLTGIRGEVWIEPAELRVARIEGDIFTPVDFGWGLLGTLYPGATILIQQTPASCCGWRLQHMHLHLLGKELMVKSLHVEVDETAWDYQAAPRDWKYHDAVHWLLEPSSIAAAEPSSPALAPRQSSSSSSGVH